VDEEDVVAITPAELDRQLAEIERQLEDLRGRCRSWSQLEALPWVVLAGEPNTGKSTLFNALLGRERAVTSAAAGTTRDVLAEPLRLHDGDHDAEAMLVDMAGLDEPDAALDRAMQAAARQAIERAELIVALGESAELTARTPTIRVASKADLGARVEAADVHVSAVTGQGLDALRRLIREHLADRTVAVGGEAMALQPRHARALHEAAEALAAARGQLVRQRDQRTLAGPELVAEPLCRGLNQLAALGGEMTPDDVIGKVFATFCVGK
ncbi:MAG: GTP-binding protein, partial [Alphaproteobacteria bacterium]|nr:GTP-binding protein [Alphaproteobacteria bacterium]